MDSLYEQGRGITQAPSSQVKEPVAGELLLARECGRAVRMSDHTLRCVELSPQDFCGSPTLGIRHNLADFFASYELCDEQGRECQNFPGENTSEMDC